MCRRLNGRGREGVVKSVVGWIWKGVFGLGDGSRDSKSERSSPRGSEGGHLRWRFGVEGAGSEMFSSPYEGPSSSLRDLLRLRGARVGVLGADVSLVLCSFLFGLWARVVMFRGLESRR